MKKSIFFLRSLATILFFIISVNLFGQANAGIDQTGCTSTFTLNGSDPGTGSGEWSVISGTAEIANPSYFNTSVEIPPRSVILRWTVNDGTNVTFDDVTITNDQVTAIGTGFMTCNEHTLILANNPMLQGATGLWTLDNQTTQVVSDPQSYATTISGLVPNTINRLHWTVTRNACSASDTVNIEYYVPNAKILISNLVHGCADTIQLSADENIGTGIGTWTESTGNINVTFDDYNSSTTLARHLKIGDNIFNWTVTDRGCSHSDQVTINNSKPINNAGTDKYGCQNSFIMNAQVPTITGTGLWSLVSGALSFEDSNSATTSVTGATGTSIVQWTITDNECSTSKQFNITNSLTYPNAGTDITLCEDRVILSGIALQPGESGQWSIDGGILAESFSSITTYNPEVTNLRQGITTFVWRVTNGICTEEDRVIVINDKPSVNAGSDKTICEDNSTLFGNNPDPGSNGIWTSTNANITILNPTEYYTRVSNLAVGNNLFTWTINSQNCVESDDIIITRETIDVVAGAPYTEACSDTMALEATLPPPGTTGSWIAIAGGAVFDDPTSYKTIARNLDDYNKLRWTITYGSCTFYDEIEFVNLTPTQAATIPDRAVCNNSVRIMGNPPSVGENGLWTNIAGSGATIANPTVDQTMVTNLGQGENIFRWTISNSYCSTSDELVITNNNVIANAGIDQETCDTFTTINANPTLGTGYWQTTTSGVIIENSTSNITKVSNLSFGTNNFQWITSNKGCVDVDEVIITSNLPRNVSAGTDQEICDGEAHLTASHPGSGNGLWTIVEGAGVISNETTSQTVVSQLFSGENIIRWTVTIGICSDSDVVKINNNRPTIPNAGRDSAFCGTNFNYQGYSSIYNSLVANTPNLTRGGIGEKGYWTQVSGTSTFLDPSTSNIMRVDNLGYYNHVEDPKHLNINPTVNTYRWTIKFKNCELSDEVSIINAAPLTPDAGMDQIVCQDIANLNALDLGIGAQSTWWTQIGVQTPGLAFYNPLTNVDDNTPFNSQVKSLPAGLSTLRWWKSNTINGITCTIWDETEIYSLAGNTGQISAGQNQALCTSNASLYATKPDNAFSPISSYNVTGEWSVISGSASFYNLNSYSSFVTDLAYQTNILRWTITNHDLGCSITDDVYITNASPSNAIAGSDQNICSSLTNVSAIRPTKGTGSWSIIDGKGTFSNQDCENFTCSTQISNLGQGINTILWTVSNEFSDLASGLFKTCSLSDEIQINNNSIDALAGEDQSICTNQTAVNAQPLNPDWAATGWWTTQTGAAIFTNPSSPSSLLIGLSPGENRLRWTVTKGECMSYDEIMITNNSINVSAGADQTICNNFATLIASPLNQGATGFWTASGLNVSISSPSTSTTNVANLQQGINTFTWTVNDKGCTGSSAVRITNNSFHARAGNDQVVSTNSTTMSAMLPSPSSTGTWSVFAGNGTISDLNNPNSTVTNLGNGVNSFRWTVNWNGCSAFDDVHITYACISANAGNDQAVCVDNTYLNAQYPILGTGKWSVISGTGIFVDSNDPGTSVINIAKGEANRYRWTVSINGYSDYDDVVILNNNFDISAGQDISTCSDSATLSADEAIDGTGSWSILYSPGVLENSYEENSSVTGLGAGANLFVWTVTKNSGCSNSDTILITRNYSPNASFTSGPTSGCAPLIVEFTNTSAGASNYYWNFGGDGVHDESLQIRQVIFTAENGVDSSYQVQLIAVSESGCSDTTSTEIIAIAEPNLNFEVYPSSMVYPDATITIENLSNPAYNYYLWEFGDGKTLEQQSFSSNISHTYSTWGEYAITLTGKNKECSSTYTVLPIIVQEPTNIESLSKKGIKLYPNPSDGKFSIEFEKASEYKYLKITNLTGQVVLSKKITSSKETVDISNYQNGTYILNIQHNNELIRTKIVIQN